MGRVVVVRVRVGSCMFFGGGVGVGVVGWYGMGWDVVWCGVVGWDGKGWGVWWGEVWCGVVWWCGV